MSGASRRVKNPLLSVAGDGFPFEHYAENTLLVPVTPTTPAVLRDDAELDNFVGQSPLQSQDLSVTDANTKAELSHASSSSSISLRSEEPKDSISTQSSKQGYFTSILSSLPNLSLSSIKGESSGSQPSQSHGTTSVTPDTNPYSTQYDRQTPLSDAPPFVDINPHDLRSINPPGSGDTSLGTPIAPPPQALPPTAPACTDGPISYRLGNQRRLKYAPPPDLTSSNTKQYTASSVQSLLPSQSSHAPPSILNPNASHEPTNYNPPVSQAITNSPSEHLITSEQHSRNSSLQGSFRSSPIATTLYSPQGASNQSQSPYYESPFSSGPTSFTASASKAIPSRIPEPATPQNTPANVSGFAAYQRHQDSLTAPILEQDGVFKDSSETNTPSEISKDSTSDSGRKGAFPAISEATFTPISAAKVTEKLEHLLAEREEKPGLPTDFSAEVTEITSINTVTTSLQSQSTPQHTIKPFDNLSGTSQTEKVTPKSEELSDVYLGEEPSEASNVITSQEVTSVNENANAAAGWNINPFRQYYQTQPALAAPSTNFFAEKQSADQTHPLSESNNFSERSNVSKESASLFFDSVGSANSGNVHYKYNSPNLVQSSQFQSAPTLPQTVTTNVQQTYGVPLLGTHPSSGVTPTFQTLNPSHILYPSVTDSSCTSTSQQLPPPPTFYNPSQLTSNSYKQTSTSSVYSPVIERSLSSQTSPFLTSPTGSVESSAGNVFLSPSISMATAVPEPTGSATLSPIQLRANPLPGRTTPETVPPSFQSLAAGPTEKRMQYRTVYHHWFYRKEVESKVIWIPFSMQDSLRLEDVHNSNEITPETSVATDGGRYDVDILRRRRSPVYWTGSSMEVRRCSWFYKGPSESRYIPYEESIASKLEEEYKQACLTNNWNRRVDLNNEEYIIFHSATVQVHYLQATSPELAASWGNSAGSEDSTYTLQGAASRPRVVKRGVDEFNIDDGEPEKVDHLLFLVHGIGSVCDLKFRTVEEVVDEFRSISLQLVQSHYRTASEQGIVNRIEVLPISWHATLHSDDTGIDKKLHAITLESIPKLRHFTNDTLLDILFYTSPIYCQTIMQTVGNEMNRLCTLFKERNPSFSGGIYLGGHSLGSLILFDLLCHQKPPVEETKEEENGEQNSDDKSAQDEDNVGPIKPLGGPILKRRLSKKISYVMGAAGTGQPYIHYPQLNFHPRAFFALGSPIGMFVTVRGIDTLGEDFALPTCPAFFNIFHPFDPVAYRVESLINPDAHKFRPMLIPHHKGRKRMHLELKETMARVGADLKQKFLDSVRSTWNSVYQLALFHRTDNQALEREIDKVVEEQLQKPSSVSDQNSSDDGGADLKVGKLNGGRRIDYVLQEAPFEYINEYIFALTSHVCYWESEDTMLLMLKEIYGSMGIQTDAQLPQQTLSIERASPSPSILSSPTLPGKIDICTPPLKIGVDPTAPISGKPVGPPPMTGFVRKT